MSGDSLQLKITLQEAENFVPEAAYHGSGLRTEILEINHTPDHLITEGLSPQPVSKSTLGGKYQSPTYSQGLFLKPPSTKSGLSHIW